MSIKNKASLLGGTMMVAGAAIGAGMLSLPIVSAGMWFSWSVFLLIFTWLIMLASSRVILEINLYFLPGDSFHSLVDKILGRTWSIVNGFSVVFVFITLVYAYISGGGSILSLAIEKITGTIPNRMLISFIFSIPLVVFIWSSTWFVDRLSVIFMIIMIFSFIIAVFLLGSNLNFSNYFLSPNSKDSTWIFIWGALSTYLTSFCFHGSIPSLVKYFGKNYKLISKCMLLGTFIAFTSYLVWIIIIDGSINRNGFHNVIEQGGNVGNLVKEATKHSDISIILVILNTFSLSAIITSFLGAGLALFDYMADLFKFNNTKVGRMKTALVTFTIPIIGGIFHPEGFVVAIAWAGLFSTIWSVITPAAMLLVTRKNYPVSEFISFKGNTIIYVLFLYGILVCICHLLVFFNVLPIFL